MKYRAEIDGLRAIAVIPVVLFHAGFKYFSGGFVGVDVFFVISGYLITTIILSEKEQGTFSLANFYERRAKRILPALFLVMFVSVPFAWWWLIPSDMVSFSKSLVTISIFSSNIHFFHDSGYWGEANKLKPLLHTWSLAVEEQYYIFFPLFLMLMWRFRKRWILSSFIGIAVISLFYAQWAAYNDPIANFFLLPSRGWELAMGAGIAFYFLYRKQTMRTILSHKSVDDVLSLIGLLMIGYAVYAFDESTPFPSFYTLIPTIGAGLIIIFSSPHTIVGRLLGTKLLVGIGLISYSAYLWHNPLFAFTRYRSLTEPSELLLTVLAVLSFALAYLSWKYVEKPFRMKGVGRKTIFRFAAFVSILFILIGLSGEYNKGYPERFNVEQSVLDDFVWHKLRATCDKNDDGKGWVKEICVLGSLTTDSHLRFAVFGDSHADAILPAFESAAKKLNVKYVHLGEPGCPPLLGLDVVKGIFAPGVCKELASRQFEYVKNNNIDRVFLVARWSLYTDGDYDTEMKRYFLVDKSSNVLSKEASRSVFERAMKNTIEAYQSIGVNVHIVEQIPQQKISPTRLYYKSAMLGLTGNKINDAIASQSVSLEHSNNLQAYNRKVFEQLTLEEKVKVVYLDDYYCNAGICPVGNDYHSFFYDENHVSAFGANFVTDEIIKYIK